VGVLLLNLGGPDKLDDVEPFLYNLFSDPDILNLPGPLALFQEPLASLISKTRAPKSREGYASIGGGSPQLPTTRAQASAIEAALARRGIAAKCYVGMRYWKPFTADALEQMRADGVTSLVVLPLYPQFSVSTSGSSLRELERVVSASASAPGAGAAPALSYETIRQWYDRPGYIRAQAKLIAEQCDAFTADKTRPHIFFSAHGVPERYVTDLNDPYQEQMERTIELVMERLRELGYTNEHTLAYQSRVGPIKWLQPYTDVAIRDIAARGVRELVVVPIAFVSEHIETLEEIDTEYREVAEEAGISWWARVPALGLDADFIDDLAAAVAEKVTYRLEVPAAPTEAAVES
jgi:ferrochelatase